MEIKLGSEVVDVVAKFKGIAASRSIHVIFLFIGEVMGSLFWSQGNAAKKHFGEFACLNFFV